MNRTENGKSAGRMLWAGLLLLWGMICQVSLYGAVKHFGPVAAGVKAQLVEPSQKITVDRCRNLNAAGFGSRRGLWCTGGFFYAHARHNDESLSRSKNISSDCCNVLVFQSQTGTMHQVGPARLMSIGLAAAPKELPGMGRERYAMNVNARRARYAKSPFWEVYTENTRGWKLVPVVAAAVGEFKKIVVHAKDATAQIHGVGTIFTTLADAAPTGITSRRTGRGRPILRAFPDRSPFPTGARATARWSA